MWERSGGGTISFGYRSVLSRRNVCLKTVPMPLATAHTGRGTPLGRGLVAHAATSF